MLSLVSRSWTATHVQRVSVTGPLRDETSTAGSHRSHCVAAACLTDTMLGAMCDAELQTGALNRDTARRLRRAGRSRRNMPSGASVAAAFAVNIYAKHAEFTAR